jgi:FMN phosphatase YigB (HAD superfamily)
MSLIIAFDADNTIWDANSVFRESQIVLLRTLSMTGVFTDPDNKLDLLRKIDFQLGKRIGKFEYDFKLLGTAILDYFANTHSIEQSVDNVLNNQTPILEEHEDLIELAHHNFHLALKKIPPLFPDTSIVLDTLRFKRNADRLLRTVLYSEGDKTRLERIISSHQIREENWFDSFFLSTKSPEAYKQLKVKCKHLLKNSIHHDNYEEPFYVMVGDNLERDVRFANIAGYITIYKPSLYKGKEKITDPEDKPCYTITNLRESLQIFEDLKQQSKRECLSMMSM